MEQLTELQKQKIQVLVDSGISYFNALHLILQIPIDRLSTLDNKLQIEAPETVEIEYTNDLQPRGIKTTVIPEEYSNTMESYNKTWETIFSESNRNYYKGR